MWNCCLYLFLTLSTSLLQTAPAAFIDHIDHSQHSATSDDIMNFDYAVVISRKVIAEWQRSEEHEDGNALKMLLMQRNLLKILFMLDLVLLIFILYEVFAPRKSEFIYKIINV